MLSSLPCALSIAIQSNGRASGTETETIHPTIGQLICVVLSCLSGARAFCMGCALLINRRGLVNSPGLSSSLLHGTIDRISLSLVCWALVENSTDHRDSFCQEHEMTRRQSELSDCLIVWLLSDCPIVWLSHWLISCPPLNNHTPLLPQAVCSPMHFFALCLKVTLSLAPFPGITIALGIVHALF